MSEADQMRQLILDLSAEVSFFRAEVARLELELAQVRPDSAWQDASQLVLF
jgi:hypothetical protein